MIKIDSLINLLKKNNCNFYTGVPDSVLKELSLSLQNKNKKNHIIATNEGSAVSLGIGYYLAKKNGPMPTFNHASTAASRSSTTHALCIACPLANCFI